MGIVDYLFEERCRLPRERTSQMSFEDYVAFINQEYLTGLHDLPDSDILTTEVKSQECFVRDLSATIEKTLTTYLEGHPATAYRTLESFLNNHSKLLSQLYSIPLERRFAQSLFRIRTQDSGEFSREHMFHIPFELRHLVTTQRYSIPGFPTLYAGSSLYVCWLELGRPRR